MTEQDSNPPPATGDKVVYCGDSNHPAWSVRRHRLGIVVLVAESDDYFTWVYDTVERDTWAAKPPSIRVIERATYETVAGSFIQVEPSAVDGAR